MANTTHACFRQPDSNDIKLWRYMDFTKFMGMLCSKGLYFCRADCFEDPFEGTFSKANHTLRPTVYKDAPPEMLQQFRAVTKETRKRTFINCWHANEFESAAMWRLYSKSDEAIAIETDYKNLANLLPELVFIGMVDYVDWENHWIPEGNLFYPFMHKRKSFEHEKEIRAVIMDFPTTDDGSFPKTIFEKGRNIEVDIQKLIKAVHISPSAPDWIKEIITQSIKKFGFEFEVKKSDLYSEPVF